MYRFDADIDDEDIEEKVKKMTEGTGPGDGSIVLDMKGSVLRHEPIPTEQLLNELDFVDDWRASGVGFMPVKFTRDVEE